MKFNYSIYNLIKLKKEIRAAYEKNNRIFNLSWIVDWNEILFAYDYKADKGFYPLHCDR